MKSFKDFIIEGKKSKKKAAERKVKDMAWDMTRIQYQTMAESEPTGIVRDVN